MNKIKILFVICILGFLFSCKKEAVITDYVQKEAVLTWTGEYAVDGCGFFITIDGHKYKPENESIIDNSFKTNDPYIMVIVDCQVLNKQIETGCGDLPYTTKTDGIKISSITKK